MSVKKFTVKTTLVAKTCALNALPICRFMESIPTTSQPMMKKQCRKQYKKTSHGKRSTQRRSMRKSNNKVPEYEADKNGCLHDNLNKYEEEGHLHFFLGESNRAARDRKGEKNMSLVCMDCNKHHLHGC